MCVPMRPDEVFNACSMFPNETRAWGKEGEKGNNHLEHGRVLWQGHASVTARLDGIIAMATTTEMPQR